MPASLKNYGNWMILKKLGQGGFGEVLHWRNSQTGQEIATKRLKDGSSLSTDERCKLFDRWRQEYNWTRNLTEMPYIVRGIFLDDTDPAFMNYLNSNHGHDLPVIVMEYCNGGDVRRLLQQPENANGLSEFEVREILRSLRLALEYLHRRYSICHRDLKPDNIVLHRGDNGKRQYKLTDFGLARHNQNLKTLQQSVVGTIHYYAPEVVDTGRYNNKVDYWSMGIIAFELCCGRLPFIPHSSHFNIIVNVGKKPRECISISQDPDSTSESFIFHNELPKERHLTEVRAKKMTYWLRSALDAKYQTRGTFHNDDEKPVTDEVQTPAIFAELDKLLDCKVLTVFAACSYKCLAYEITPQLATISELQHLIARDTGIAQESVVLLLPTGHPHKRITEQTRPADLFVDHWQDTSGRSRSSIPPVMIYVLDLNGTYNFPEPNLTPLMRLFMPPTAKRLETWMSRQLALEVNFLLSEEQRKFKMLLLSLRDHVLTLEDALLTFKPHIEALNAQKLKFMGAIDYFCALQNAGHEFFLKMYQNNAPGLSNWEKKWVNFSSAWNVIRDSIDKIIARFESVLRDVRKHVDDKICDKMINQDHYKVEKFRATYLRSYELKVVEFREILIAFAEERNEALNNQSVKYLRESTFELYRQTIKISYTIQMIKNKWPDMENQFMALQLEVWKNAAENSRRPSIAELNHTMGSLTLDDSRGEIPTFFDPQTPSLIDSALKLKDLLVKEMETD